MQVTNDEFLAAWRSFGFDATEAEVQYCSSQYNTWVSVALDTMLDLGFSSSECFKSKAFAMSERTVRHRFQVNEQSGIDSK